MQELENQFISSGGSFKEYKIGELFEVYSPKKRFNANTVSFGGNYSYVVRTSQNNGVRGYITEDEKYLSPANTFSFGQDTATVFYQERAYFTGDKIKIMKLKNFDLNQHIACYLLSLIRKAFSNFSWGQNSFNEKVLNETGLCLPTKNNQPDFAFMEEYIHVLERERVHVLETYLQASGLDTYDLTDAEISALNCLRSGSIVFKQYKIGELFEVKSNPQLNKESFVFSSVGKYPYFTRTVMNNGILGYVEYLDEEHKIKGNSLAVGMLGMQFFYMKSDFYAGQFTKTVYPKFDNFNEKKALYFIVLFNKLQKLLQGVLVRDFERTFYASKISLPTKNNQPDFDFMETYIHAVEKIVIKNVVAWKDKEIEKTKEVVA